MTYDFVVHPSQCDFSNFTAWSSIREPSKVFVLLERVYSLFDRIAERRGVCKIETIGDTWMGVCGLPHPQRLHAVIMVRFAAEARDKFRSVVRELEPTLGPGTGDLEIRWGLNSGPVTAGVLRGQKARFQLFGDTGANKTLPA